MLRAQLIKQILDSVPQATAATVETPPVDWWEDNWAKNVFTDSELSKRVPKSVYKQFKRAVKTNSELDSDTADVVANAMKDWAVSRGATHYTHWFQPIHTATAEKHDGFLDFIDNAGKTILKFGGSELIRGEPDASSFPNGGIRSTYEARGYTTWDPTSPPFIRQAKNGATLVIPTCFCSWTGAALDVKTPLLRACSALSEQSVRLLRLLGDEKVESVQSNLGIEQEFFVVDRSFFTARPDLVFSGRTIFGAKPPKGQEMEDHYFATMPPRILAFIQDCEHELWKLGIPTKCRHNEVAPGQHEMAPIYELANTAADHNMVMMDLLRDVAERHNLSVLLHEKPFGGINGSGKHNNWSIATDYGLNLFDPTLDPKSNFAFHVFLTACIKAVDEHADLLRASIAVPGNDWRLGANEAPPAIMSIYLGSEIDDLVNWLIEGEKSRSALQRQLTATLHLGKGIASFQRDRTDRNRTSPFAFTGNKFEFRAVGSSQSVGHTATILNTIMADAVRYMANAIEAKLKEDPSANLRAVTYQIIREELKKHQRIIFNGNGYSPDWVVEAEKRGLLNLKESIAALNVYASDKNIELFDSLNVLHPPEVHARKNIYYEHYSKTLNIEAQVAENMASVLILPAGLKHQEKVANSIKAVQGIKGIDTTLQEELLVQTNGLVNQLIAKTRLLREAIHNCHKEEKRMKPSEHALWVRDNIKDRIADVREVADALEQVVEDDLWVLPKYSDILFVK